MAFNQSLTTNHPVGTTNPRDLDTIIKDQVKEAFRERLNVDHDFSISDNKVDGTNVGTHRKVTITVPLGSAPSVASGQCQVYGRTVSGRVELFHKNYDGAEIQLTRNGVLNVNAAALVGLFDNTTITQSGGLLAVKDGGVSRAKLNADVVDNVTLENVAGGIRVKSGGVGTGQLANASVTPQKLVLPSTGGSDLSVLIYSPIVITGSYSGNGGSQTLTLAPAGFVMRHIMIRCHDAGASAGGVEGFSNGSIWRIWFQPSYTFYDSGEITPGGNQITLNTNVKPLNESGEDYSYQIMGTYTPPA